jgi:hypothetical protein
MIDKVHKKNVCESYFQFITKSKSAVKDGIFVLELLPTDFIHDEN